jgi:hypothetical protein
MSRQHQDVGPVRATIAFIIWIGVGLVPVYFGLSDLRVAFGLTGTPGMASVERCIEDAVNETTDCRGQFVPDDSAGAPRSVDLPPESDEGETFRAQLQPDGERAVPSGFKGRASSLILPALGFLILVPFPWILIGVTTRFKPGTFSIYTMGALAAVAGGISILGLFVTNL